MGWRLTIFCAKGMSFATSRQELSVLWMAKFVAKTLQADKSLSVSSHLASLTPSKRSSKLVSNQQAKELKEAK